MSACSTIGASVEQALLFDCSTELHVNGYDLDLHLLALPGRTAAYTSGPSFAITTEISVRHS
jgi:hypothetical protein